MINHILEFLRGKKLDIVSYKIGALFTFLSFWEIAINPLKGSFPTGPNFWLLIIGIVFCLLGLFVYISSFKVKPFLKKNLKKGIKLQFDKLKLFIKIGRIEDLKNPSKDSAVVLPANSSFEDECIKDTKSALGSFFMKYHTDKLNEICKDIEKLLSDKGVHKQANGLYPDCTTIILSDKYDAVTKCILTASTIKDEEIGFESTPDIVSYCLLNVFRVTADKKVAILYMPVIGSGHGGMDINLSLIAMMASIKHYSKYFHHIKEVYIVIREEDKSKIRINFKLFNF